MVVRPEWVSLWGIKPVTQPLSGDGWGALLATGKLRSREDVVQGLEIFPETFLKLFDGYTSGKLMLQVHA